MLFHFVKVPREDLGRVTGPKDIRIFHGSRQGYEEVGQKSEVCPRASPRDFIQWERRSCVVT